MNSKYRKKLAGSKLDYFDAQAAVDALQAGAWGKLPYTARVHAENIVRKADPAIVDACLLQIIDRKRERDFPWYPARVVCHDILGQTALVDLAGLRDAIAKAGGDPAQINPVVPVQLIVDHSLERFEHWQRSVRQHWGSGEPDDERPRFPACTLIPVPKLALPGMLIEVEATAAAPIAALTQPVLAISPAQALREATAA